MVDKITRKTNGKSKPTSYRPILQVQNAKTIKDEELGYLTGICYLAPGDESGVMDTCQFKNEFCYKIYIFRQERGHMKPVHKARIAKTLFLHSHRSLFIQSLRYD